jgi:hypothetical protein
VQLRCCHRTSGEVDPEKTPRFRDLQRLNGGMSEDYAVGQNFELLAAGTSKGSGRTTLFQEATNVRN